LGTGSRRVSDSIQTFPDLVTFVKSSPNGHSVPRLREGLPRKRRLTAESPSATAAAAKNVGGATPRDTLGRPLRYTLGRPLRSRR